MTLRGRGVGAVLAAVLLIGAAGCSGDGGGDDGDPTSAPTSGTDSSDDVSVPAPDPAAGKALCDVLTAERAAAVNATITRQTLSNSNQCGYAGKGGAVLLLTGASLSQAGASDEQNFFDLAAEQYGGTVEDLDVGSKGGVVRTGDGIVDILWTVDHTTYWTLLGTFNKDDDATYDAMVALAQSIATQG